MLSRAELKSEAIRLRNEGYSYGIIKQQLSVSKGTLSEWLSGISFSPNKETIDRIGKARAASALARHRTKEESIAKAISVAKDDIGILTSRDIFMLGIGLYIGEGTKAQNNIRVVNSDPKVIRFAIKWFETACGLQTDNFRVRLHMYPDNNPDVCLNFWSEQLNMPRSCFSKNQIDRRLDKKSKKAGKLAYGTAHLSVVGKGRSEHGVFLSRRIKNWMQEVLK